MSAGRVKWTRRVIIGLVIAAVVVGFVGRHGGAVLTSFALAFAALAIGLLSMPDGDPEVD
jgi:threonine/homoserine efflux transporter RhtA